MARRPSSAGEVTITEAARLLGVSRQRVYQLIKAGKLAARQVMQPQGTRLWLIQRAAVEQHSRRANGAPRMRSHPSADASAQHRVEDLIRRLQVRERGAAYASGRSPEEILTALHRLWDEIDRLPPLPLPADLSEHLRAYLYGGRGIEPHE